VSAHRRQGDLVDDVRLDGHLVAPALLVVASSSDSEIFYTPLNRVLRYDRSRTTSLCCQGNGKVSSLSD
jgi:hypothetical protein